jgi:hypothetical protein
VRSRFQGWVAMLVVGCILWPALRDRYADGDGAARDAVQKLVGLPVPERTEAMAELRGQLAVAFEALTVVIVDKERSMNDRLQAAVSLDELVPRGLLKTCVKNIDVALTPAVIDNPLDEALVNPFARVMGNSAWFVIPEVAEEIIPWRGDDSRIKILARALNMQMPRGAAKAALQAWVNSVYAGKLAKVPASVERLLSYL